MGSENERIYPLKIVTDIRPLFIYHRPLFFSKFIGFMWVSVMFSTFYIATDIRPQTAKLWLNSAKLFVGFLQLVAGKSLFLLWFSELFNTAPKVLNLSLNFPKLGLDKQLFLLQFW